LSGRNLQPLASPDPLNSLVVDQPTGPAQQLGDLAIAVAAVLPGQFDDVGGEPCFIVSALRYLALRRAMLAGRRTGASLGQHSSNSGRFRLKPVQSYDLVFEGGNWKN